MRIGKGRYIIMTALQILDISDIPETGPSDLFRQNPPDKCFLSGKNHCGIWWKNVPPSDARLGIIGHYIADDEKSSRELLGAACNYLRRQGCSLAIGPMDGSTWKAYRLVTWSSGSPPFLMEPTNPPEWPHFWTQAGFSPYHEYISNIHSNLDIADPRLTEARKNLESLGIQWRAVDIKRFKEELRLIYHLSLETFSDNVLYTPITETAFLQQYLPFTDRIDRDFVLLAEDSEKKICGFIFALPDFLQMNNGGKVDRLIIKTLAVSREHRNRGLGAVLADEIHKRAFQKGMGSVIHALMHTRNLSTKISKNTQLLRRYTLFKRELS